MPIEWQFLNRDGELLVDSTGLRNEAGINLKRLGLTSAQLMSFSSSPGYVEERHLRRPGSVITGYAKTQDMRDSPGLHWGVLVRVDRAEILAPGHRLIGKVGIIGGTLFLPLLGLLYWTTRRLRLKRAQTLESKAWLFTTLKSVGEAVIATDLTGRVMFMNGVAESLTGWNERDAKGQPLETVFHLVNDDISPEIDNPVKNVIREGLVLNLANRTVLIAKDRTERAIDGSSAPIRDTTGLTAGVVLVFRGTTDCQQATARAAAKETAQRAEATGRDVFENAAEGIYRSSPDGRYLNANPALARLYGYDSPEDLIAGITDIQHQVYVDPSGREEFVRQLKQDPAVHQCEARVYRKDGSVIWVSEHARAVQGDQGALLYFEGTIKDVTERKRAEGALRDRASQLKSVTETVVTFLENENWPEASRRLLHSALSQTGSEFGFMGFVVEGPSLRMVAHEGANWNTLLNGGSYDLALDPNRETGYLEVDHLRKLIASVIGGGKTVHAEDPEADHGSTGLPPGHQALQTFLGVPIRRGEEVVGVVGIANRLGGYTREEETALTILTDIAGLLYDHDRRKERGVTVERQRKQAEERLAHSHEQLRRLTAYLEWVTEEERTGIARELHDDLGATLTSLQMDLIWVAKLVFSEDLTVSRDRLLEKIQSITEQVDDVVRSVQNISLELRPDLLDHLGLASAMEEQAQEFQTRMGMHTCEFANLSNQISLDRERATALFRVFQALLVNVARHAQATRVAVRLHQEAEQVVLEVRDNGKGITEAEITSPESLGLMRIRERMRRWGGEVCIRGVPQQGTTVTVRLPLHDLEPSRED